jgi:hypothetical protein
MGRPPRPNRVRGRWPVVSRAATMALQRDGLQAVAPLGGDRAASSPRWRRRAGARRNRAPAGAKSGRHRCEMEARPERQPDAAGLRSRHDPEAALEADACSHQTGLLAARGAAAVRPEGLGSRLDRQLRTHLPPRGAPLNPDLFITIVFGGFAAFMAVAALVFVIPKARRDDARASELGEASRSGEAAEVRRPRSSDT